MKPLSHTATLVTALVGASACLSAITAGCLLQGTVAASAPTATLSVQTSGGPLDAIACVSATKCFAVGAGTVVMVFHGVPGRPVMFPKTTSLSDINCPTATNCYVMAGTTTRPTWEGSWEVSRTGSKRSQSRGPSPPSTI